MYAGGVILNMQQDDHTCMSQWLLAAIFRNSRFSDWIEC